MHWDVCLGPAEYESGRLGSLSGVGVVVLDVLRFTSTVVMALEAGAVSVRPVMTVEEALAERERDPDCLLAGEREGLRIEVDGVWFDLGNSPREFTREKVRGRRLVMTTTNGTRAVRAAVVAGARWVVAGAFLNVGALVRWVAQAPRVDRVLLVCSGTGEGVAYEDVLGAGAILQSGVLERHGDGLGDAARVALGAWQAVGAAGAGSMVFSQNARRLMGRPELADDVAICARRSVSEVVPEWREGVLRCVPAQRDLATEGGRPGGASLP
jgi:2-phosphosulfolactate phosphatase